MLERIQLNSRIKYIETTKAARCTQRRKTNFGKLSKFLKRRSHGLYTFQKGFGGGNGQSSYDMPEARQDQGIQNSDSTSD